MIKEAESLNIGDRIELTRKKLDNGATYSSQILDILDDGNIIVSGPIYKNKSILLHKDEIIEISYIVKDKGRYSFEAKVLERENIKVYKLELQKVSDTEKLQLRWFYRFAIDIPMEKEFIIERNNQKDIFIEKCRTKDISGGGLNLYSNYKHKIGDITLCKFNLDEQEIVVKGKVVRMEKIDTFKYDYSLGIELLELNEKDRDKIIQFIFTKQRILREKGLV